VGTFQRTAFAFVAALAASAANAALLLDVSWSKNLPFGPFLPNESIEVIASVTNVSPDQTITICEGPCIGDSFTYSFGGLTSFLTASAYSFYFGDDPVEAVFDGQIAGTLLPGQEKDFVFGVFTPPAQLAPDTYTARTQLQIFDATAERTMLAAPTLTLQWEVLACSQFPGGGATGGCFPGPGPFPAPEPGTLALIGLALAGMAAMRRRSIVRQRPM
jgi:hypothetical protein